MNASEEAIDLMKFKLNHILNLLPLHQQELLMDKNSAMMPRKQLQTQMHTNNRQVPVEAKGLKLHLHLQQQRIPEGHHLLVALKLNQEMDKHDEVEAQINKNENDVSGKIQVLILRTSLIGQTSISVELFGYSAQIVKQQSDCAYENFMYDGGMPQLIL